MVKITWTDRSDTASDGTRNISASIFNDTKTSVNAAYDIIEARLGTTSSADNADLVISGTISISGSIIPNTTGAETTSSFNLGSETAAWKELYVSTASINFVSPDGTITKWSKQDVVDLKAGKSLRKSDNKQIVNENDASTYVRMSSAGRAFHYASDKTLIKLQTSSFDLGDTTVPAKLIGSSVGITGSVNITGSSVYTTTDLLTLLGNFGQTGSFAVTGSSNFTGDVNMDGAVTTQDLLTVIAGISSTGSVNNSGSFTNEGTGSFTGSVETTGSTGFTGSMGILPPPISSSGNPITKTLYYGYKVTSSHDFSSGLNVFLNSENPNSITEFKFQANSQPGYNSLVPPTDQTLFFTGLAASASGYNPSTLTFTPSGSSPNYYTSSYKFEIDSVIDSSSEGYFHVNVSFIESSSIYAYLPANTTITPTESLIDNRFKFFIAPQVAPEGGFVVGDLLNVLSNYGDAGLTPGELGDYTFDGAVNLNDLLFVLGGLGNSNQICEDIYVPNFTNHQLVGPTMSICDGNFLVINQFAFCSISP